jgi:hypothetical protein
MRPGGNRLRMNLQVFVKNRLFSTLSRSRSGDRWLAAADGKAGEATV